MNSLVNLKTLASILEDDGWSVQAYEDDSLMTTAIKGEKAIYRALVFLQDDTDKISYQLYYEFVVLEDLRRCMSEAIARMNCEIGVGSLFLDFDDGQIGFKHTLLMEDNGITSRQFVTPLYVGTSILDYYYGACQKIMYGGFEPKDAVESMDPEP